MRMRATTHLAVVAVVEASPAVNRNYELNFADASIAVRENVVHCFHGGLPAHAVSMPIILVQVFPARRHGGPRSWRGLAHAEIYALGAGLVLVAPAILPPAAAGKRAVRPLRRRRDLPQSNGCRREGPALSLEENPHE